MSSTGVQCDKCGNPNSNTSGIREAWALAYDVACRK